LAYLKLGNKSFIMVVVACLSKYAHFCALQHPSQHPQWLKFLWIISSNSMECLILLFMIVIQLLPTISSKKLFRLQGTQLHLNTTYHPQSDGQTKSYLRCLETYLSCFVSDRQHQWVQWLPLDECWYNISYHTTTHMTPFEVVYGEKLPMVLPYISSVSKVHEVDHDLTSCMNILCNLKDNLVMDQNRMKK
jgi:hypothetical protein